VSLAGFDIHHLQYVSLGGGDEATNLAVVCPNCHRNFAHRLYASEQGRNFLAEAAQRWADAVMVGRVAASAVRDPVSAAQHLMADGTRNTLLAAGAYSRLDHLLEVTIDSFSDLHDAPSSALTVRLLSSQTNVAYYTRLGLERAAARLHLALKQLDFSAEFDEARNDAVLASSRLLMLQGEHQQERRILDGFKSATATEYQRADLSFRMISVERYLGSSLTQLEAIGGAAGEELPGSQGVGHALERAKSASLLGELAKAALLQGEAKRAETLFMTAFELHRAAVNRRGMAMTALRLADLFTRSGDGEGALLWWFVFTHCGYVGVLPEHSDFGIQSGIVARFGESILLDGALHARVRSGGFQRMGWKVGG